MTRFKVNIQSVSDIITNSSSEIFSIRTDVSPETFREVWNKILKKWGYNIEDDDDTILVDIYEESPGELILSYPVMCNVGEDISSILKLIFGSQNITSEYYG